MPHHCDLHDAAAERDVSAAELLRDAAYGLLQAPHHRCVGIQHGQRTRAATARHQELELDALHGDLQGPRAGRECWGVFVFGCEIREA